MHYLGIISDEDLSRIKDIAMCRYNVKASKRAHIAKILDEAFKLVVEYQPPEGEFADLIESIVESSES